MEERPAAMTVADRFQLGTHADLDANDVESVGGDDGADSSENVTYHVYDLSLHGRLRRALVRNSRARLCLAIFDFCLRVAICVLYLARVLVDDSRAYFCQGGPYQPLCPSEGPQDSSRPEYTNTHVGWYVLLWVRRPLAVYVVQLVLSLLALLKTFLAIFVAPKGHRVQRVWTISFWVEVLVSFPYLVTLGYPPLLRHLYIPSFLNCWLAKIALEKIFNDLHMTRQKFQTISVTMYQQIILLVASLMCLIFTTVCGIEHIQRASYHNSLTLWQAIYFTIVTFSTVGYGDISPDIWPSELFMVIMICVAFASIPRQLEKIGVTFLERQKAGGEYHEGPNSHSRHVVVCASVLTGNTIKDFLSEFYAHTKFEEYVVIMLCSRELDSGIKVLLKDPKWAYRVIFMRGSPTKDIDLKRCRIHQAEACFLLAHRASPDKAQADQHTILRSWAVKDFAPSCKQYIQLFHAKNKMHIKFAEHVVCEDEFKYALLAHNCLYPGLSTLVALLVHTSAELVAGLSEKVLADRWQQVYGRHSGNEIYHIQLQKSIFFQQFKGKSFPEASAEAHRLFGVCLVAVLDPDAEEPRLLLNPGPEFRLQRQHYCFYLATQREEHARVDRRMLIDPRLLAPPASAAASAPASEAGGSRKNLDFNRNIEKLAAEVKRHHPSFSFPAGQEEEEEEEADSVFSSINSRLSTMEEEEEEPGSSSDEAEEGRGGRRLNVSKPGDDRTPEDRGRDDWTGRHSPVPGQASAPPSQSLGVAPVELSMALGNVWIPRATLTTGHAPVTTATGSRMTVCHIMAQPRSQCCLEWGVHCEHCRYKNASDGRWKEQLVLLAAQRASSGIYNFIIPLRSNFINKEALQPIILLLEQQPDQVFLETIAQFPLVYWMLGSITTLDDLLRAGITKASHVVVVNRERDSGVEGSEEEESLSDSDTILATQTIFKMFPNANVITELSQASNMRFMHFRGHDKYCQKISRLERKLKETMPSTLSQIFRLPFAAGHVFSASMLDTLLYQTFVKGYLITFVRLLLGMDAEQGSGHLSSIQVTRERVKRFPTYGELYKALCRSTGEIPIAIYRTQIQASMQQLELLDCHRTRSPLKRRATISAHPFDSDVSDNTADLVRSRLCSLEIDAEDYQETKHTETVSYVISNPTPGRRLKEGDIVYVIQPSSMTAVPTKPNWWTSARGDGGHSSGGKRRGSRPYTDQGGHVLSRPPGSPESDPASPFSRRTFSGELPEDPGRKRGQALDSVFPDVQSQEGRQASGSPEPVDEVQPPGATGQTRATLPIPTSLKITVESCQGEEDDASQSSGTFSASPRHDSGVDEPEVQWEEGGEGSPARVVRLGPPQREEGSNPAGSTSGDASPPLPAPAPAPAAAAGPAAASAQKVRPLSAGTAPTTSNGGVLPIGRGVPGSQREGAPARLGNGTGGRPTAAGENLGSSMPLLAYPGEVTTAGEGKQLQPVVQTRF